MLPVAHLAPGMRVNFQTMPKPGQSSVWRSCQVLEVDHARSLMTFRSGRIDVTVKLGDVLASTLYWDKP